MGRSKTAVARADVEEGRSIETWLWREAGALVSFGLSIFLLFSLWLAALATASVLVELAELAPPRLLGGIFGEFLGQAVLRENFGTVGSYCLLVPLFLL